MSGGAVSLVVVRHGRRAALQGQARLGAGRAPGWRIQRTAPVPDPAGRGRATILVTFSSNRGSLETLKRLTICGLRLASSRCARRWTGLIPISAAIVALLEVRCVRGRLVGRPGQHLALIATGNGLLPGGRVLSRNRPSDTLVDILFLRAPHARLRSAACRTALSCCTHRPSPTQSRRATPPSTACSISDQSRQRARLAGLT